jgi:hypothetical protein
MARESKAARWSRIHQEARAEFDRIQSATWDDRVMSLSDRCFVTIPGAQWAGMLQEPDEQRAHLELDKIGGAITRLEGEHRNNRCTVNFLPKDGAPKSDKADACDGLYRADEQDSDGDEAYDNAFTEAVTGGVGAWRYRAELEDESSEDDGRQRIRIEPIVDADVSVFWDLDSKKQSKADARCCFVTSSMSPEAYRRKYKEDPASWDDSVKVTPYGWVWYTPEVVNVAEYYVVDRVKEEWLKIENAITGEAIERRASDFDADEDDEDGGEGPRELATLLATGGEVVERKTKKVRRVMKYIMSGARILKEQRIPGEYIPIVSVYGQRKYVQNKERWFGHVRKAKDAQRVLNMLTSRLAEIAAYTAVEVPIFAPEQINAFAPEWAEHNIKPKAYLRANPLMDADGKPATQPGPIGWTKVPDLPPALAAMLQFIGVDLKELLGSQEQGDKLVSNISGKAVEMIQQHLDAQVVIYLDNFKRGMRQGGVIYQSMMKEVYVEPGRKMKTVGVDGKSRGSITLREPGVDEHGTPMRNGLIDLSSADFDVVVDVGPSTTTKKAATVRNVTAMLSVMGQDDPQAREALLWTAIANMEGEGMAPLNDFGRLRLVKLGVVKPNEQEQQQLAAEAQAAQQPDPQQLANLAFAEKEKALAQKAVADTAKSQADTQKAIAETEKIRAQTMEVVAGVDMSTRGAQAVPGPR